MSTNPELLRELSYARDRLLLARGAAEQAGRAVEAARAAARRCKELEATEAKQVARLEGELATGESRMPLIDAIERPAHGRNGTAPPRPCGPKELPAAAPPAAGWRAVPIAGLPWAPGVGILVRDSIVGALAVDEVGTVAELGEYLAANDIAGLNLDDAELRSLVATLRRFREMQGWTAAATWPDGMPESWLRTPWLDGDAPEEARRVLGIPTPKAPDVSESEQDGSRPPKPARPAGGKPAAGPPPAALAGEQLDALLVHACRHYDPSMREFWEKCEESGAGDDTILIFLRAKWPHAGRVFVGRDRTKGAHGYTITASGGVPCLWVNAFREPGHVPDLSGQALVDRVRAVFGIPRPEPAPAPVDDRPPGADSPRDEAGLRRAIAATEGPAGDGSKTWICLRCGAGYPTKLDLSACPSCQYGPRRTALGLLEDLARPPAGPAPGGITIGGRPLPAAPKRDRKAEAARRPARQSAGKEAAVAERT